MGRYIDLDKLSTHKFTTQEASHNDIGGAYRQGWNDAIDAIVDNEPAADVRENVRGEWVFKEDQHIVDGYDWQCNQCGSWQRYTSNYCPNCGADMRGGDAE